MGSLSIADGNRMGLFVQQEERQPFRAMHAEISARSVNLLSRPLRKELNVRVRI
jgi:hypothetical protein